MRRTLFFVCMKGGRAILERHELAFEDYKQGLKYKDIARKHGVAENTVKSWVSRYNWVEKKAAEVDPESQETDAIANKSKKLAPTLNSRRKNIEKDLFSQLDEKGIEGEHFRDLVRDYLSLWDVKTQLIYDIELRGVVVEWSNGKQTGEKKNESVSELNKTNAQMLKLLSELGLKAIASEKDDDDDY